MSGLKLRPHVRVEKRESGARLVDDSLVHSYDFGPNGARLLELIDGERTVVEIVQSPDDEPAIRRLFLLNLVEGAGDDVIAKIEHVTTTKDELDYILLEGARFQCHGSGACCQNYVFGPLDDEDIATLEALPIAGAFPALAGVDFVEVLEQGGYKMMYLRSEGERCVFLEKDLRCGLHLRFGAESKPKICRLYPYEYVVTVEGTRLFDKGSCASFALSSRSGPSAGEDLPRLRKLLPKIHTQLYHPAVVVDEYPCDYSHFDRVITASLDLVKRDLGTAATTLRAISRGFRGFAQILRSFPLEPGEPAAAIGRFLEIDAARWYQGEPSSERVRSGALYYSEMFSTLLLSASKQLGQRLPTRGHMSMPLVRESAQLFHIAAGAMARFGDPQFEVDEYVLQVARVPVNDPQFDDLLRISLRQQLFGTGQLVQNHCLPALIRMAIIQIMAVTGARMRALEEGHPEARAVDLSWGQMLATRLLGTSDADPILLAAEDSFPVLLEALPVVLDLGYGRPMP